MDINEVRRRFIAAIERKFPGKYNAQQRLIALSAQVGELGDLILIRDGVKKDFKGQHNSPQRAVIAALIDLLALSELLEVDLDEEIAGALDWFEKPL